MQYIMPLDAKNYFGRVVDSSQHELVIVIPSRWPHAKDQLSEQDMAAMLKNA